MRPLAMFAVCCALLACEGPMGPEGPAGPEGPEGPQGEAGSLNKLSLSGTFPASGSVTRNIPADAAPSSTELPNLSCYTSDDGQTWLVVDHLPTSASGFTFCGLVGVGTANPGVQFIDGLTGWRYLAVVSW